MDKILHGLCSTSLNGMSSDLPNNPGRWAEKINDS